MVLVGLESGDFASFGFCIFCYVCRVSSQACISSRPLVLGSGGVLGMCFRFWISSLSCLLRGVGYVMAMMVVWIMWQVLRCFFFILLSICREEASLAFCLWCECWGRGGGGGGTMYVYMALSLMEPIIRLVCCLCTSSQFFGKKDAVVFNKLVSWEMFIQFDDNFFFSVCVCLWGLL